MRVLYQIEYERPATAEDVERGHAAPGELVAVETMRCVDVSNPDSRLLLHETLDELLEHVSHRPISAKFWVGGECKSH